MADLAFQGLSSQVSNSFFANGVHLTSPGRWGTTTRCGPACWPTTPWKSWIPRAWFFPSVPSGQQTSDQPISIADNIGNNGLTAGVYLQDEWRLTDKLTFNYGARYDRFDANFEHEGQLSPRANLVWQINDKTSAHFGYARYFTPPSVQYHPAVDH